MTTHSFVLLGLGWFVDARPWPASCISNPVRPCRSADDATKVEHLFNYRSRNSRDACIGLFFFVSSVVFPRHDALVVPNNGYYICTAPQQTLCRSPPTCDVSTVSNKDLGQNQIIRSYYHHVALVDKGQSRHALDETRSWCGIRRVWLSL